MHKYKQSSVYKNTTYFYCINQCGGSVLSVDNGQTFVVQKPHSEECIGFKEKIGSLTVQTVDKVDDELKRGIAPRQIV